MDKLVGLAPQKIFDPVSVLKLEEDWRSVFDEFWTVKKSNPSALKQNPRNKAVAETVLRNKIKTPEDLDCADLIDDIGDFFTEYPEHSDQSRKTEEAFFIEKAETLDSISARIIAIAEKSKGYRSATKAQQLYHLAKIAYHIADQAFQAVAAEGTEPSPNAITGILAEVGGKCDLRAVNFNDLRSFRAALSIILGQEYGKISSGEKQDTENYTKLKSLEDLFNVYSLRLEAQRSVKQLVVPVNEEDGEYRLLGDLYFEEVDNEAGRSCGEFVFPIPESEKGFKSKTSIVFYNDAADKTNFVVSGYLITESDLESSEDFTEGSRNEGLDGEYKPMRVDWLNNIRFYLHPDGEFSIQSIAFNSPDKTKELLGDNYSLIRAYILYALGLETVSRYKVSSPQELMDSAKVHRESDEGDKVTLPHKDRKILLEPSQRKQALDQAFDKAESDLALNKGRSHTRLLSSGKPSQRAYQFSKDPIENPSGLKLRACLIDLDTLKPEWIEIPSSSWAEFRDSIKKIVLDFSDDNLYEIRFQTFVRKPKSLEEHTGDVKQAVLTAADTSPSEMTRST